MTKKRKIVMISLSSFFLTATVALSTVYFSIFYSPKGKYIEDNWYKTNEFSEKYVSFVEKKPNKDFTILNFTDLQISDFEPKGAYKKMKKMMKELVDRTNPDLITLTGDNIWTDYSKHALKKEVRWLEEFEIPWAPVFGNHDDDGTASVNHQSDVFEKAEHCLYKRGPSNIGPAGNYVVAIKESDKIVNSLYMLNFAFEDSLSDEQVDFVKWNADGIKGKNAGNYPKSMVFLHKPIGEYSMAYFYGRSDALTDIYRSFAIADISVGRNLLEVAKEINVKDFVCGHQHGNAGTIPYEGINYTFALKTGDMCSIYEDDENPDAFIVGATSITLKETGNEYKLNFVDESYRIKSKKD